MKVRNSNFLQTLKDKSEKLKLRRLFLNFHIIDLKGCLQSVTTNGGLRGKNGITSKFMLLLRAMDELANSCHHYASAVAVA